MSNECASSSVVADEQAISLIVDGVSLSVPKGATILDAAEKAGSHIPTLCFLKERSAISSCRICMVEVEGEDAPVPACSTVAKEGMVITTASERLVAYRKLAMDLILSDHGLDSTNYCFSCKKNGACELQAVAREVGVQHPSFEGAGKRKPVFDSNPFISFDPNLCIRCQRCVGACNSAAGNHSLHTAKRGLRTSIEAPFGPNWKTSGCESCGNCVQACPTGALTMKRRAEYREWEVERVLTTCPHCATGCQYNLIVKNGRIVDTEAVDGPQIMACCV